MKTGHLSNRLGEPSDQNSLLSEFGLCINQLTYTSYFMRVYLTSLALFQNYVYFVKHSANKVHVILCYIMLFHVDNSSINQL